MSKLFKAQRNTAFTENGALAFNSTLNPVLDIFSRATRGSRHDWHTALQTDFETTVVLGFYIGDIRGGLGERALFKQFLRSLPVDVLRKVLHLIPFYSRWDVLIELIEFEDLFEDIVTLVSAQLDTDLATANPSLLAKWMPSENASNQARRNFARALASALGMTMREYRKTLTELRERIEIVEARMSAQDWNSIEYARVPSVAHNRYRKAFGKHNPDGYAAYLNRVKKGEDKINADVLFPYDIVRPYLHHAPLNQTLEAQWNALPDYMNGKNAIVVADVSGSMINIGFTLAPIDVAVSLAIYAAERSTGAFANEFITFSDKPAFVTLRGKTLKEKVQNIAEADWGCNTNFNAVFNKILRVAVRNSLRQEDLPDMIFVVSDMQFDVASTQTNFEDIRDKFTQAGYIMPKFVFWNVRDAGNSPVTEREEGVYLVSGCNARTFQAALTTTAVNPLDMMYDTLSNKRYDPVRLALR